MGATAGRGHSSGRVLETQKTNGGRGRRRMVCASNPGKEEALKEKSIGKMLPPTEGWAQGHEGGAKHKEANQGEFSATVILHRCSVRRSNNAASK